MTTRPCLGLVAALLVFPLSAVRAQEAQIQVLGFGSGEMTEEMREGLADRAASMSFSMASPGGAISLGGPVGGVDPNSRSQLFNLLSNESVRHELQLSEEQYGGVQKIMKASQARMTELIRASIETQRDGGAIRLGGEDFMAMREENQAQAEAAIEEILLPEQLKRVRQLAYQVEISNVGIAEALTEGRLGEEIGVHEDQYQHLIDRAAKIESLLASEAFPKRPAARKKMFAELTPEQRKAAEKLLGEYFQYEEVSLSKQLHQQMRRMRQRSEEQED